MDDDDEVRARYDAEFASERVMRALEVKLSWLPAQGRLSPDALEHLRRILGPDE